MTQAVAEQQFAGMPAVEGVTHRMVDAGGVKLHVAEAGAGEPVMLIHGWPQHWWLWRNVIPTLAEHYKVYAPDIRGFGWSEAPRTGYGKHQLAADFLALIDSLEIDQPIRLAGHDWGGWTSFLMAMQAPERFHRFLALNIPPAWGDPRPFNLKSNLKALSKLGYQVPLSTPGVSRWLQAGGGRKRFANGLVKAAKNQDAWANDAIAGYIDQFKDPQRSHATMMLYRTMLAREVPKIAMGTYAKGRLKTPTRILFGADDVAVSLDTIMADHSKKADDLTVEVVENCGHFIVDEQPQLVVERMLDWFAA
ncbi:MAG: alpha/beta fold hydrolase [Solirubrobacterales bacterium]